MMGGLKVEALFGGLLALVVLGVAIYAITDTTFGGPGPAAPQPTAVSASATRETPVFTQLGGQDLICECYDKAFSLAGKVTVLSPEYRTGFEQCRARAGIDGGDAWTAGWNARLSARPYESSCRTYKRNS
jgi:hypothetical protein